MSVPAGIMFGNERRPAPSPTKNPIPTCNCRKGQYETSVPTVADRVAQTVVAMELEKRVEPMFHPDSYGYRPKRSALDAVAACRKRCWRSDWVIDLDIQKFLDALSHCGSR
jgi:retron-type reverse transcriptase